MNRNTSKFPLVVITLLTASLFISCVSLIPPASATASGPRTLIIDTRTINEEDADGFTTWICTDYIDGGKILLEVGFFGDPALQGLGFILFDGGYLGELAYYQRAGLQHRWDWGPRGNEYAFTIDPEGTGRYYDFSIAETTKASSVYKCYRRKP